MRHFIPIALLLTMTVLSACNNGNGKQLSTDLITNPKSAEKTGRKAAEITFDKTEHDFGKLLQGEVVSYTFHFTNTGNAPLLISKVNTSCGCTVGEYSKEPIAPGKKGTIKATYASKGHHDIQTRSLTVTSNTNPSSTVLRIKANVLTADKY